MPREVASHTSTNNAVMLKDGNLESNRPYYKAEWLESILDGPTPTPYLTGLLTRSRDCLHKSITSHKEE